MLKIFKNKFLIVISLLNYYIQLSSCRNCQHKYCYKNETYFYDSENFIAAESDMDDVSSINQYSSQLISKDFAIILNFKGKLISTTTIDSFNQNKKYQKIICKLSLDNEQYFIQCTDAFVNDQNQDIRINEKNTIYFQPKFNMNCDNFFQHHHQSFVILCHTQTNLLIYLLDLKNVTTLLINHQLSLEQIQKCKKQYFQFSNEQYFVAYYKCQDWAILKFENDTIKTILNFEELFQTQQGNQYQQVEDVSFCQQQIYLIFYSNYLKYNHITKQFEEYFFEHEIKQLVLNKLCNQRLLLKSQNLILDFHYQDYKQFSIPSNPRKILQMDDYLFIQYEKIIFLRINSIFNQTFSILQSTIYFIDEFNFFYQIDAEKHLIQVYKYKFFKDYIQPTKKYLYLFQTIFNLQMVINSICYQFTYLDQFNNISNQIEIYTQDQTQQDCNQIKDVNILKDDLILDESFSLSFSNQSQIQSIQDRQKFNYFCYSDNNQSYLMYLYQHFYIQIQHDIYLIYSKCNNSSKDQRFELRNIQLIQYKDFIIFFKLHDKKIKLIYHNEKDIIQEEIQIYAHIVSYKQFNNYLLIFTDQEARPLLIKIEILNLLIYNYINEDLYLELPIKFYHRNIKFELVQYPDFILVKIQNKTLHFKMPERQIIQIELIILNLFEIITVHVENNQIEIFYLNQEELLSIYYYQIIGYQLVTPVHYVIEEKYLAIVSVKDNLTFIHIFSTNYNSTLKLLDIIQISRLIFFISDYNLYYYDSTQQLMIYDLKYFQIKLNPLRIIPDHSQYSVNISLISSSQKIKNLTKKFTLKLTIKQFCYQILLRTSKITLNSKNLQYRLLNLNKYFYGPIHNLTIDDSSTFTILGPYIINGIIMECNKTSMNKCIYQTQISLNSIFLNLYFFKKEENFYLLNSNKQDNTSIVLQLETELLTFDIDGNFIVVKVYQFDFKNQKKLIQRISKQFQYQGVNNFEQTWSYTGKLVKFLGYNFYISQTDIYLLESVYQNIIYVQGSQKLYLEILWSNKWISNEIEINIYSIEDGQLNLNQVLLMKKSIIIEELHRNEFLSDFSITNFQILSSSLDDNILQIEVLQNNHQFSLISLLIFELNKSIQQYIIKYVLRNPLNDEIKSIECYKNLIILKSYQKNYLFDLREKQIYYDYFSSFILSSKLNDQFDNLSHQIFNQKIKQITTIEDHNDLIFVTEDNEYYYGSIGYIILGNSDKEVQFKLRATNDISSQTLLVTLQADKFLEQILGVLGIMIIIIVFLYFWRRNRLKIQNQEKYGNKINNIYI